MAVKRAAKLAIVLFALVAVGLTTVITTSSEEVFADKKGSKKNQKTDQKIDCEINIDHNKNSDVGPNNQLCDNDSISLIDSTLIQSPSDNGSNIIAPRVLSVDPQDDENNVPLNTDIMVTFDRTMDQGTLNDGSLSIFNSDSGVDPEVSADPSAMSVTYTLDSQLEPGTRYEAELSTAIQDKNGNFLDCSDSNAIDSSCRWQFETTGSSSANIELSPTSGPLGSSVHITGTGFDPNSNVIITFGIFNVATSATDNNGEFSSDFTVPIVVAGPQTVSASDGINSDSATFTVTSSVNPIIAINPSFGPVGTPVNITGINFDPNSEITITFAGNAVTTTPTPVITDNNGVFSANFTIPTSTLGTKTVSAIQGSNSDSTIFTVTSLSNTTSTNQQLDTNPSDGNNGESIATQGILPF